MNQVDISDSSAVIWLWNFSWLFFSFSLCLLHAEFKYPSMDEKSKIQNNWGCWGLYYILVFFLSHSLHRQNGYFRLQNYVHESKLLFQSEHLYHYQILKQVFSLPQQSLSWELYGLLWFDMVWGMLYSFMYKENKLYTYICKVKDIGNICRQYQSIVVGQFLIDQVNGLLFPFKWTFCDPLWKQWSACYSLKKYFFYKIFCQSPDLFDF